MGLWLLNLVEDMSSRCSPSRERHTLPSGDLLQVNQLGDNNLCATLLDWLRKSKYFRLSLRTFTVTPSRQIIYSIETLSGQILLEPHFLRVKDIFIEAKVVILQRILVHK